MPNHYTFIGSGSIGSLEGYQEQAEEPQLKALSLHHVSLMWPIGCVSEPLLGFVVNFRATVDPDDLTNIENCYFLDESDDQPEFMITDYDEIRGIIKGFVKIDLNPSTSRTLRLFYS